MEKDKKVLALMIELAGEAEKFISSVKQIGNQCAYTDGIVENIINLGTKLRNVYDE